MGRSVILAGRPFRVLRGNPKRQITKGETTMSNNTTGNQFSEDEIIILEQLRDKNGQGAFTRNRGGSGWPMTRTSRSQSTEIVR
jgi:hypothetical protein